MTTELVPRVLICALLMLGSIAGLMATDLVLPAIPILPEVMNATPTTAQFVLAAFVGGITIGLIVTGMISHAVRRTTLLIASFLVFGGVSYLAALSTDINTLILLRFLQGAAAAVPAVIAPGIIRQLFSEVGATKAFGVLGSLESLAPAIGPIIGAWLLGIGGWQLSFTLLAWVAVGLAVLTVILRPIMPRAQKRAGPGRYLTLLRSPVYLRYAVSQACSLGCLLVFVFAAPAIIVRSMDGALTHFITMQVLGVATFMIAANTTGFLVSRFGPERMIWLGTGMMAASAAALTLFAVVGSNDPRWLPWLFIPMNMGIGFRGPPGFLRAVIAGSGDDDRASSLMILAIFGITALVTAVLAPFLEHGLIVSAGASLILSSLALMLLWQLPQLPASE